ncbi:hypothetical protein C8024_11770 [Sphingopyxis sp. BSNA05]|uniref:alpha/beta fold hydrolase n=1 Tax=Sphingopyxis sp. BSNA05 TaxID=1236614 RepID=UPI001567BFCF|nr:alpha/beta hydrolase [Sphingopyxis sp. BSNA05]NRD89990.1 hypothetical protein [Sphingopyxis sp. BSNA05]
MQVIANGINIEVEDHGNPADPAILLVMGYTAQLIYWPMDFVNGLVAEGFRVVTFDNRDVGLSYKFDGVRPPHPIRQMLAKRFFPKRQMAPYNLSDMANDAVGVLDALKIDKAHIVGASMGGMIGQLIAADHADRVLSFTPIMSSTNGPGLPGAARRAQGFDADSAGEGAHAGRGSGTRTGLFLADCVGRRAQSAGGTAGDDEAGAGTRFLPAGPETPDGRDHRYRQFASGRPAD